MDKELTAQNIILIDKSKGISSFDVIRKLRKKYGNMKMGHAGTLDPPATGLMIIGINEGTKKLEQFLKLPKVYEADILLGKKTTTGDMEGEVIEEKKVLDISKEKIQRALDGMVGKIKLPVPIYSAIKVAGRPLYELARKGTKIIPPIKEMEILWIKMKDYFKDENHYVIRLELEVKSGSYIRSIAEEIGKRLGLPATTKELRRTKIGDFKIEDAVKIN